MDAMRSELHMVQTQSGEYKHEIGRITKELREVDHLGVNLGDRHP